MEPTQQHIRKGICLILWRAGRGKAGKTVSISLEELTGLLHDVGIKAAKPNVKLALLANIKGSWIERTDVIDESTMTYEYKLSDATRQRANEIAVQMGTDLLPKVPVTAAENNDSREIEDMPTETKANADNDQAMIDGMLNVLSLASEAKQLKARVKELETATVVSKEVMDYLHAGAVILRGLAAMKNTPLGMLLDEQFKNSHPNIHGVRGGITEHAESIAVALSEHFNVGP